MVLAGRHPSHRTSHHHRHPDNRPCLLGRRCRLVLGRRLDLLHLRCIRQAMWCCDRPMYRWPSYHQIRLHQSRTIGMGRWGMRQHRLQWTRNHLHRSSHLHLRRSIRGGQRSMCLLDLGSHQEWSQRCCHQSHRHQRLPTVLRHCRMHHPSLPNHHRQHRGMRSCRQGSSRLLGLDNHRRYRPNCHRRNRGILAYRLAKFRRASGNHR